MSTVRSSGILLHPTSLPGPYGIGDLGLTAYQFVDFLVQAGQRLWQMLPCGPCGEGHSPYMSYGSLAGNHLLISPDLLVEDGYLSEADLDRRPTFDESRVNYRQVQEWKSAILHSAFDKFRAQATPLQRTTFEGFCRGHAVWLDDFAQYVALRDYHQDARWTQWPDGLRHRVEADLNAWQSELATEVEFHKFVQYSFYSQWFRLKTYANSQGIRIVGDLPIYVAHASADVWANQPAFQLHPDTGEPVCVAGVPPDYFSASGQLWGNPVYNWDYIQEAGFSWWLRRLHHMFALFDLVRLDHFRGLDAYWTVPAGDSVATNGRWIKAPGRAMLTAAREAFGYLPIIAEDLGDIGREVTDLRDEFGLPGMKVLQFAFSGGTENPFLPMHYVRNCVVYTGTHDNNTTQGWLDADASDSELAHLRGYLGVEDPKGLVWALIRLAMSSPADRAIIPLQDVLGIGSGGRMNRPGTAEGNWAWRLLPGALTQDCIGLLRSLSTIYGRLPRQ